VPQPNPKSGANISTKPTQQTASRDSTRDAVTAAAAATDVTGSLPRPATPLGDKLPATIGGPALRAAALSGDAAAAYEVGTRFSDGHGVPRSSEAAALWFERAAKQGLAPAQFRLGGFYEKGIGVKKDLAAARDLYLAAAGKGNGKAMHNLAVLYAEGVDGPADYTNAAHWFREAADHGVTDSQYNLGILYARGTGVTQNYAESYKWFALAAIQGDQDAAKKSDEVAAHLDQQSLAAARLAVKTWTAQPQPDDAINVKTPQGGWDATASAAPAAKPKPQLQPQAAKTPAPSAKIN
jgi:localization factor PodJL